MAGAQFCGEGCNQMLDPETGEGCKCVMNDAGLVFGVNTFGMIDVSRGQLGIGYIRLERGEFHKQDHRPLTKAELLAIARRMGD